MSCQYCIAHHGPVVHHLKSGKRMSWNPKGPLIVIFAPAARSGRGASEDRVENWGEGGLTARLFVGLSVGQQPTYNINDIVTETRNFRLARKQPADASFIAQKGIYTNAATGSQVTENSVQIIIFAAPGVTMPQLREQMEELGKHLRRKFDQDQVIIELQDRGVVQQIFAVER
jgi:hypothetical protein